MYFWAPRGRPLTRIAKRCFCQENSTHVQQSVISSQHNQTFLIKRYTHNSNLVYQIPLLRISPVLQATFKRLPTMNEHEQCYSTSSENQQQPETPTLSNKDKLKRAVKDYGATVIVFHVTISLMSLGVSYLVISSGVDVASLLDKLGITSKSDIATGASTFVVAYAVHKIFAPVRISITLGSTPFIVRYLRRAGILKPPKSSGT